MFLLIITHPLPLSRKNNLSQQTFGQKSFQTNGASLHNYYQNSVYSAPIFCRCKLWYFSSGQQGSRTVYAVNGTKLEHLPILVSNLKATKGVCSFVGKQVTLLA